MIKAVLFDMDGVITDTEHIHYEAWRNAFKEIGITVSLQSYYRNLQSRNRVIGIRNIIPDASDELVNKISKYKDYHFSELISNGINVYDDSLTVIKQLNEMNVTMAVVSSSSYAKHILKQVNLDQYFDFVVSGTKGLDIRNKPYPDIYLYAMKQLNVSPKEVLIIEDSVSGCKAGTSAKAKVIGVCREEIEFDHQNLLKVQKLSLSQLKE